MAKAKTSKTNDSKPKKTTDGATSAAKNRAAARPGAAKKNTAGVGDGSAPQIDTNLAASSAAAMILNRAMGGTPASAPGAASAGQLPAKRESDAFKSMKDSLNKSSSSGLGGSFGTIGAPKKTNQNFGGGKQVGRNQTFGADVNRAGVPRRTGGG